MRSRGRAAREWPTAAGLSAFSHWGDHAGRKSIERAAEVPRLLLFIERLIYEQSLIEGG
jgi:hypothetical protein